MVKTTTEHTEQMYAALGTRFYLAPKAAFFLAFLRWCSGREGLNKIAFALQQMNTMLESCVF